MICVSCGVGYGVSRPDTQEHLLCSGFGSAQAERSKQAF